MKKSYLLLSFMFLLSVFFSCNNGILGDAKDTIGLKTREVLFMSDKDSIELQTSKGNDWWLSSIKTSDSIIVNRIIANQILKGEWFYVEKTGRKSLFIRVEPNLTGLERKFTVEIQDGNDFNSIDITQKAKE